VNDDVQAAILLTFGALAVRLGVTDAHLAYVRPAMAPWLVLAGLVLVLLAGTTLLRPSPRAGEAGAVSPPPACDHHDAPARIVWLLLAPVLAIGVVAPPPLGAFAADRAAATGSAPPRTTFGPLPAPAFPGGPIELPITEFVGRARHDGPSLDEAVLRLTGFVVRDSRGGGFLLTRFVLSCCAADARPVRVAVRTAPPFPAPDTWVEVTGRWRPERRSAEDDRPPVLDAESLRAVPRPARPYLG
jgi:uncharacterized repeat protein (TIGR03943 family)